MYPVCNIPYESIKFTIDFVKVKKLPFNKPGVIFCLQKIKKRPLINKAEKMALVPGFEPGTNRLTGDCSTAELHQNGCYFNKK
jgi:hypothetical protein